MAFYHSLNLIAQMSIIDVVYPFIHAVAKLQQLVQELLFLIILDFSRLFLDGLR